MGTKNYLKSINNFLEVYPEDSCVVDKQDLKDISRELCRAHKDGSLSTEIFQKIIEHLLAYYIEQDLEEKFLSKSVILDNKISKISRHSYHQ